MKCFFRAAALLLAAVIFCVGLAGCGGDHTWAFESGGVRLPTGLYILYEIAALDTAGNQYVESRLAADPAFVTPMPSELLKEQLDGVPIPDFIAGEALQKAREYYAAKSQFEQRGLTFTETDLSITESATSSEYAANEAFYVANGISESSVLEFYMDSTRRNRLFNEVYGLGGEREVPEEDLKARLAEQYYLVNMLPIYRPTPTGEDDTEAQQELQEVEEFSQRALKERLLSSRTLKLCALFLLKPTARSTGTICLTL